MAYFLLSVSNKTNLDLCLRYALAGFTNSINGLWTFVDIEEGDFVSFLYGAKVFNLYRVASKEALKNADAIGPWSPVTFRTSGRTYYFPFRLRLQPVREFTESMVRSEFAYVAENLLLRGGYRKTHFQADQTTLQVVSEMGEPYRKPVEVFSAGNYETFTPCVTWEKTLESPPETFLFQELLLQSLVRHHLSRKENLQELLDSLGPGGFQAEDFEVLGEKALPEGHIDILIKDRSPRGCSRKIVVEVKLNRAQLEDLEQLEAYLGAMGEECLAGILIAKDFSRKVREKGSSPKIRYYTYTLELPDDTGKYPIKELRERLRLRMVEDSTPRRRTEDPESGFPGDGVENPEPARPESQSVVYNTIERERRRKHERGISRRDSP
jgi:hypothetical protein